MSFLNSVLGSIGQEGSRPPLVLPPPTTSDNNKRKAEEEASGLTNKATKTSATSRPSPAPTPGARSATSSHPMPYRGTSKQDALSTSSGIPIENSAKQPKKGSYKEIMARAQAAAAQAKTSVGTINHKPKDKTELSHKKEMKIKQKELRDKKLGIVRKDRRPSSSDGSSPAPGRAPNAKKVPQTSYTGTAKPKPQSPYRGTMGSAPGSRRAAAKSAQKRRANEYAATDDELDSEEEEDGEEPGHEYSDAESDDMEAGFSDVEHEESAAAKAARKEDEEEAKLEVKHKMEKEERKRKLEMMAKKAKPPQY